MNPNATAGKAPISANELFKKTAELYRQFGEACGLKDPDEVIKDTEAGRNKFIECVEAAMLALRSKTRPTKANPNQNATDDPDYNPQKIALLAQVGQSVLQTLIASAQSHSYAVPGTAQKILDTLSAKYSDKLAAAEQTLARDARITRAVGAKLYQPIVWAVVGRDLIAKAYANASAGMASGAATIAQSLGIDFNLPGDVAAENTVEVTPDKINGLTKFGFRHFYQLFGNAETLYGDKANYLPELVLACETGYSAIFNDAITSIEPDFFTQEVNEDGQPTGHCKGMSLAADKPRLARVFNTAVRKVCSDLTRAIEARSELIDAIGLIDNDAARTVILDKFVGVNRRESSSNTTVRLKTDMGVLNIETAKMEGGTTGAGSLRRGNQDGYMRPTGIATSSKIINKGVSRTDKGATVSLNVYGDEVTLSIADSTDLDNYVLPMVLYVPFHNNQRGWVVCKGLAPFSYMVDGGLQQDAALMDPNAPAEDAAAVSDVMQQSAENLRNKQFGKVTDQISAVDDEFNLSEEAKRSVVSTLRKQTTADPKLAADAGVALGVLNTIKGSYGRFRHDVAEAFVPGSRNGTKMITTGQMTDVVNKVSKSIIIDMLMGRGGDNDERLIREKTMQDVKAALISKWAGGANYDVRRMGYEAEDDKVSAVAALMYDKNGALGISRGIFVNYMRSAGNDPAAAIEQFESGAGLNGHATELKSLVRRYLKAASIIGVEDTPDEILDLLEQVEQGDLPACAKLVKGSTGWFDEKLTDTMYSAARTQFDEWCLGFSYDNLNNDNTPYRKVIEAVNSFYDDVANAMFSKYDGIEGRDAVKKVVGAVRGSLSAGGDAKGALTAIDRLNDFYAFEKVIELAAVATGSEPVSKDVGVKAVASGAGLTPGSYADGTSYDDLPSEPAAPPRGQAEYSDIIGSTNPSDADAYGIGAIKQITDRGDKLADGMRFALELYDGSRAQLSKLTDIADNTNAPVTPETLVRTRLSNVVDKLITIVGDGMIKASNSQTPDRVLRSALDAASAEIDDISRSLKFGAAAKLNEVLLEGDALLTKVIKERGSVQKEDVLVVASKVIAGLDAMYKKVAAPDEGLLQEKATGFDGRKYKHMVAAPDGFKPSEIVAAEPMGDTDDIVDSFARLVVSPKENNPYKRVDDSSRKAYPTSAGTHDSMRLYNVAMMRRINSDTKMRKLAAHLAQILGYVNGDENAAEDDAVNMKNTIGKMLRPALNQNPVKAFTGLAGNGIMNLIVNDIFDDERKNDKQYHSTKADIAALMKGVPVGVYSKNLSVSSPDPDSDFRTRGDYNTKTRKVQVHYGPDGKATDVPGGMTFDDIAKACGIEGDFSSVTSPSDAELNKFIEDVRVSIAQKLIKLSVDTGYTPDAKNKFDTTVRARRTKSDDDIKNELSSELLPKIADGSMPLADFVFALNGDVERYALSYEMATSPSRMYANSKIKSDGKYRNENDPNNLFTASRAQKIFEVLSKLPPELGEDEVRHLAHRYFTEVGERDEISHTRKDIADVFKELESFDLIDRNDAASDIDKILEQFYAARGRAEENKLAEKVHRAEGTDGTIGKLLKELPGTVTGDDFREVFDEYFYSDKSRHQMKSQFPAVSMVIQRMISSNAIPDFLRMKDSADAADVERQKDQVADECVKLIDRPGKEFDITDVDKAIDLLCKLPPKGMSQDDLAEFRKKQIAEAVKLFPPIMEVRSKALSLGKPKTRQEFIERLRNLCSEYAGVKPSDIKPDLSDKDTSGGFTPNTNVRDFLSMNEVREDEATQEVIAYLFKQGVDIKNDTSDKRGDGYVVTVDGFKTSIGSTVFDKAMRKTAQAVEAGKDAKTATVSALTSCGAKWTPAAEEPAPAKPKAPGKPVSPVTQAKNRYENMVYQRLLANAEKADPSKFKDHRPIDPALDEQLMAEAERQAEAQSKADVSKAKTAASGQADFNKKVAAKHRELMDKQAAKYKELLAANDPNAEAENPERKSTQLYNEARKFVQTQGGKEAK